MFVILNSINDQFSIIIIMFVNINIILPAVHSFLAEKNARFEVFWFQLHFLEY